MGWERREEVGTMYDVRRYVVCMYAVSVLRTGLQQGSEATKNQGLINKQSLVGLRERIRGASPQQVRARK